MIKPTPLRPIHQLCLPLDPAQTRPVGYYEKPDWDDRAVETKLREMHSAGELPFPYCRYPLLKSYNGATGQERRFGGNLFYCGVNKGVIPRGHFCSVCTSTKHLGAHNENYFRPCNARPVCRRCHMRLHKRFYDPNPWLQTAYEHAYPGAWFTKIALSELTREQSLHLATLDDPFDARQL